MLGIPKLIIILGVLITSILYWANTNVCRYNFAIEKRTNVLNIVTKELDPTLGRAEYYQYVIEFEYTLPFDIGLSGQLFFYDLVSISDGLTPIIEAQVDINLTPEDNFIPGLGAPLSLFSITETPYNTISMKSSRTIFLNLKKTFYDLGLELNFRTYADMINKGSFMELESIYDLNDSFKVNTAINFISGNNTLSEAYLFNPMEDFSHFRVEFRYSF